MMKNLLLTSAGLILHTYIMHAQTPGDTSLLTTNMQEVVLSGIRARTQLPITQSNLNQVRLKQVYYGADLPIVLQRTPAIHAYSDNGTGIGYSFFRLRGIDQTRINVTINGVPVNDPENQGVFFNNIADLTSSAQSVQVQRGVGTSTNGAAAFGGSVAIESKHLSEQPSAEITLGAGSFQSRRITAEVQTGKIGSIAAYVRLSNMSTAGYRDRSGAEVMSYFISVGHFGKKSMLRFNAWGGDAQSQLAYVGIDASTLATQRKANPFTRNETDRFRQHFFQLQYQYQLSKKSSIQASAYYVRGQAPQFQVFFGAGPFFPYGFYNMPQPIVGGDTITETDAMVSYRLDQHFAGAFVTYTYRTNRMEWDAGIHANTFRADHFMETQWMRIVPDNINLPHRAYFNTGYKQEASAFAKANIYLTGRWNVYGDIQMRAATFTYSAQSMEYAQPPFSSEPMSWLFINPKVGTRYEINSKLSVYAMVGRTSREPTRFDYFQDDFATRDVKQNDIKPETVTDIETGITVSRRSWKIQSNIYYMLFNNAIINTGQVNTFGYPITTNVNSITRSGIEFDITWKPLTVLDIFWTSAFSNNRIESITQFYSDGISSVGITYQGTAPALTPSIITNQGIRYSPFPYLFAEIQCRYMSEQFVDNSQTEEARIKPFFVTDMQIGLSLKKWTKHDLWMKVQINNMLDAQFSNWGSVAPFSNVLQNTQNGVRGSVTPLYFVAPGRNYFLTIAWKI